MDTKPITLSEEFKQLCEAACKRVKELSIDDVEQQLKTKPQDCILIDVRDKEEYDQGFIAGAKHLSKGWIEAKIYQLTEDKDQKIILYCGGGHRSVLAADNLQKMGYRNIFSMCGGIKAWVNSGKKIQE